MPSKQNHADRTQNLSQLISNLYKWDIKQNDKKASQFQNYILEMFEVAEVFPDSVDLAHLFNDDIYGPVLVNEEIRKLLRPRDVFLMSLGFDGECWHVINMSTPYDSVECHH